MIVGGHDLIFHIHTSDHNGISSGMASMFMREARMMQYYRHSLSQNQQTPWICNVFKSATCSFSKSHGPVRYVPRIVRQTPAQSQDEQTNSDGLNDPNDNEGTNKHVCKYPLKAQQAVSDPRLVEWGHLGHQQKAEADARSGSYPSEKDGTQRMSIQPSYESSCKMKTGSFELSGAKISTQNTPLFSQHSHSRPDSPNSSYNPCKAVERSTLISVEDRSRQQEVVKRQIDADYTDKSGRRLPRSSVDWAMPTLPADVQRDKDAENLNHMVKTREEDLLPGKAGRVASLHASKGSASLSIQGKHLKNREADIQGKKAPPWQDAESFLLKVQKAKQNRSFKPLQMRHTAATTDTVDLNEDVAEGDFTDDDGFVLFKQETPEESEYIHKGSHGMAELEYAKNQAMRYLALRPYTALQLREKLIARSIAPSLADEAVGIVQRCGLQSDLAYAETFSSARFNHGSWGPQRIKLRLKQRGIDDQIIKIALDKVFSEEEGNIEQGGMLDESLTCNSIKMSNAAMDHLLVQATKHWNRGRHATNETKTRRMVSWLQYRGFSFSIIKHVLKHLQRGIPMEDEH